jgi:hypothetical protein
MNCQSELKRFYRENQTIFRKSQLGWREPPEQAKSLEAREGSLLRSRPRSTLIPRYLFSPGYLGNKDVAEAHGINGVDGRLSP